MTALQQEASVKGIPALGESAGESVFSQTAHDDAMRLIQAANGSLFAALTAPVKAVVAWLGIDLARQEDWARLIAARNALRERVQNLHALTELNSPVAGPKTSEKLSLQSGSIQHVPQSTPAANDSTQK